jgi:hypothetical protein
MLEDGIITSVFRCEELTAAARNPACDAGGDDEYTAVRISIEGDTCLTHQKHLGFDIDCVARIPVLDSWLIHWKVGGQQFPISECFNVSRRKDGPLQCVWSPGDQGRKFHKMEKNLRNPNILTIPKFRKPSVTL